uniref:Peptidase S1 domain-containing protein n=1 Tax=Zosterops lateralis melanops TaxID=1220523 RepID=A0A8D2NMQ2_ZOSLA
RVVGITAACVILTFPISLPARIIGGKEVKRHSRPYMAYLDIQKGSERTFCGGFLIRPDAVLSAAHCLLLVFPGRKLNITVILGAHNIRDKERSQQRIHVRHWVIHPKYSHEGFQNDIVLLKVGPNTSPPGHLPKPLDLAGAECKVAGWGQTSVTGDTTNVMREVKLKVQNGTICQQLLKNYQPQSMICVGDDYSKKGSYKVSAGDSGGPLICKQKAHGIVFTRISYFEPWIREQLRKFSLQDLPGSPSSD